MTDDPRAAAFEQALTDEVRDDLYEAIVLHEDWRAVLVAALLKTPRDCGACNEHSHVCVKHYRPGRSKREMLQITFVNDRTGTDEASNYTVTVSVNGRAIDAVRVTGHRRADAWFKLVHKLAAELPAAGKE